MSENNDLLVRPVHPNDATDLYEIISNPQVASTFLELPSREYPTVEAWLADKGAGSHRLVIECNGRVIGSGTLNQKQNPRNQHTGYLNLMVHPDYWGKGVGSHLMDSLLNLADNWLNLIRIELEVSAENEAAIHLYEKFGFELEGTRQMAFFGNGRFQDEHLMSRLTPNAPRAFPVQPPVMPLEEGIVSIEVRPLHPDDTEELHQIAINPAVARTINQIPSQELSHAQERIAYRSPWLHRYTAVANCEDGSQKVVGNISVRQHENPRTVHVGGIGMMVHPHCWSMGIGSKLMGTIVDLADNWLNLKRLELDVHPDNPFAIRLYKNYGFEIEGTKRLFSYGDGRWTDAYFMARLNP